MSFATLVRGCGGGIRQVSAVATRSNNNNITQHRKTPPRRFMGGGGQPISQSMEAELWQGHPKEPQGWETTVYLTYAATAVILGLGLGFAPDTSIKTVSFFILSSVLLMLPISMLVLLQIYIIANMLVNYIV